MLSKSLKDGLTDSGASNTNSVKNNNIQSTSKRGHNMSNRKNPWISSSTISTASTSSVSIGNDMDEDDDEDEDDNNLLYFKPKKIYKLDTHPQEKKSIDSIKNEYVPDLNFSDIVKKWEFEEYLEEQEKYESKEKQSSISPPSRLRNDSSLTLNDKSKHSQVEPIPLPNFSNSITGPSTLELERRASYMNLITGTNAITSAKNTLKQNMNPLIQKYSSPFIPRSRRSSSLRGFPSPMNIQQIIGLDALTPTSGNNNNNINNNSSYNNSASAGQSNMAAPLPIIPTDTTMASIDVNMSTPSRSLDEASFSSASSAQLRYGTAMANVSTIPIDVAKRRLRDDKDIYKQYFNSIAMDKDEFLGLIKLLPTDFLNLPYSQRKAKILGILPRDKFNNYRDIMSLIKKVSLTSPKSNTSLGTSNIDIPKSADANVRFNNGNNSRNSFNNNNNNEDANLDNVSGLSLHRHNSVASQYLSTFSPSSASLLSLNNNNGMSSSFNSKVASPSEKGMQLFNYTLGGIVGFGAWGMIRKCRNNDDGSLKAVKVIKFKNDETSKERVLREINIWNQLRHDNILPLLNYQIDDNYAMYCLTELIQDGTLYDLVLSWDNFSSVKISNDTRCKVVVLIARQLLDALKYLHQQMKVVHGDIKLENCLLDKQSQNSFPKDWKVILCDFGMSYSISDCYLKKNDSQVGSLPYASPELLNENKLDEQSDIWAFGTMLYTMLVGKLPFKHPSESSLRELIKAGKYDKQALYEVCSNKYKELTEIVTGCLVVDLDQRWILETIQGKLEYLYHKRFQGGSGLA
ncbi:hypothetical protein MOSE0_J07756 [Monosporozyma servazzii]